MSLFDVQFRPEEIEIAIFTMMRKAHGDNRMVSISIIAWQDLSSGEIHEEKTSLIAMGADIKELNKHIKSKSVLRIKVQKSCEGFEECFRFLKKTNGRKLPELKKLEKTIRKELAHNKKLEKTIHKELTHNKRHKKSVEEVYYNDEILGKCKLCHKYDIYEVDILWLGDEIELRFCNENEEKIKTSIGILREMVENQNEWDKRIREYAADNLTKGANDWNEDHEISKSEFKSRISLTSISVDSDGSFEFWFDDDNIFLEHAVLISGDVNGGPNYADIPG